MNKRNFKSPIILYSVLVIFVGLLLLTSSTWPAKFTFVFNSIFHSSSSTANEVHHRLFNSIKDVVDEIKQVVPEGAKIELSPREWVYLRVSARYLLYPFELQSSEWDYFIDFENKIKDVPSSWTKHTLSSGVNVYAKEGRSFLLNNTKEKLVSSRSRIFWAFAAITVFYIVIGFSIMSLLGIKSEQTSRIWYWSTSYLMGFICMTLLIWFYMWMGAALTSQSIGILWALVFILLMCFTYKNYREFFSKVILRKDSSFSSFRGSELVLGIFLMFTIITVLGVTVLTPVFTWDAMSHWVLKAKIIFEHGQYNFGYTHHNEYPLLWPQSIANVFVVMNGAFDEAAKWSSATLFLALLSQIYGGLATLGLNKKFVYLTMLIYLFCFFTEMITSAYAENGFLVMIAGVLTSLIYYFKSDERKYFYLCFIFALGLSTVKLEGAVATGIIALVIASMGNPPFRKRKNWVDAGLLLLTLLVPLFWIYRQIQSGYFVESIHSEGQASLANVKFVLQVLPGSLYQQFGWGIFVFFILVIGLMLTPKDNDSAKEEHLLFWTTFLLIGFTVFAFLSWEITHLRGQVKTISRIFYHSIPALILYFGLKCKYFVNEKGNT